MTAPAATNHRVVACTGDDGVRIEERPVPRPGPGELLLGLRAVGLCGTDLFKLATGGVEPGLVLGHELVGEVLAAGPGVDGFRTGDRVAVPHHVPCGECPLCRRGADTMCAAFRENLLEPGGFAERVVVRSRATSRAARRVPQGVRDEAAVFMEPAACVLRSVERSGLSGEGVAAVLGAGSMGLLHLLVIGAHSPEIPVLVVDPDPERRDLARTLGAHAVTGPGDEARGAASALSGGLGVDAVFDTVGGARVLGQGLALLRAGGSLVLFAHAGSGELGPLDLNELFRHERRVLGSYSGGPQEQSRVFEMLLDGRLEPSPLVTHVLPLDRFEEGLDLARDRRALKVLFTPVGAP